MRKFTAYFDGACEPKNPGGTPSFGALVMENGVVIWEIARVHEMTGESTSNVAEYAGLISVLEYFLLNGWNHDEIEVRGDSQLVIQQCFGTWRIKAGAYVALANKAKELLKSFSNIRGRWIARDDNQAADDLSKSVLTKRGIKIKSR